MRAIFRPRPQLSNSFRIEDQIAQMVLGSHPKRLRLENLPPRRVAHCGWCGREIGGKAKRLVSMRSSEARTVSGKRRRIERGDSFLETRFAPVFRLRAIPKRHHHLRHQPQSARFRISLQELGSDFRIFPPKPKANTPRHATLCLRALESGKKLLDRNTTIRARLLMQNGGAVALQAQKAESDHIASTPCAKLLNLNFEVEPKKVMGIMPHFVTEKEFIASRENIGCSNGFGVSRWISRCFMTHFFRFTRVSSILGLGLAELSRSTRKILSGRSPSPHDVLHRTGKLNSRRP
jgi:hypothetical protein